MKGITMALLCAALFLPAIAFPPGADAAPARESGARFGDAEGREWKLVELRRAAKTVLIDREIDLYGFGEIYTIKFEAGRVSGMGAPNRFFGPYTVGGNRALRIGSENGALASTLMMPLVEPEFLREHEYFGYLSRVYRWDLREGNLELFSTSEDGSQAVLVFVRG